MIYFDNAATGGVKPENVVGAAAAAMRACANPGRSGHALSLACAERVQKVRGMLCEFFGAPSADRVIFTKNCTEALNIALLGCIKEGDKVVTTVAEHNSVLRPLKHLEGSGAVVRYAPLTRSGDIDIRALSAMAQGACAVVVTLASNVTGAAPDIAAVRRAIPESMGRSICLHLSPLSQNATTLTAIDRITNPHRHPRRPFMKSSHFTPLNEKYSRTAATATDTAYFNIFLYLSFIRFISLRPPYRGIPQIYPYFF